MGSVKNETTNQGRGVHEWDNISLSEVNTIKSLIKYRVEYDKFYEAKKYETNNPFITNGVPQFYEIIEVTYLDLERLIKNAKLNEKQIYIIKMCMRGYDFEYISQKLNCAENTVSRVFDTACEKIKQQNDFEWYEWIETSGLIKVNGNYKKCNKCGRWLKVCEENFSPNNKGLYGYHSMCKNCR